VRACFIATLVSLCGSGVDSSRDFSCVDHVLFETLINYLLVSVLTPIANKILPSGSGVDSSRDCSCVDHVLFETLMNYLLVSVLTPIARQILPVVVALIVHCILAVWIVS